MKIKKYIFKFINHNDKTCLNVVVSVHSGERSEWTQDENDVEGFATWMAAHARWEMKLKNEITKVVASRYFKTTNFADYQLSKEMMKNNFGTVNMNSGKGKQRMRDLWLEEINIFKYQMGSKPTEWTDVYNYTPIEQHHHFFLIGNESNGKIDLREIASFEIPQSPVRDIITSNTAVSESRRVTDIASVNRNQVTATNQLSSTNRIIPSNATASNTASSVNRSNIPSVNRSAINADVTKSATISGNMASMPIIPNMTSIENTRTLNRNMGQLRGLY